MECSIEDCDREAASGRKGMCLMHYARVYKTGSPIKKERIYIKCKIDNCNNLSSRKSGLCLDHYKQSWYLQKVGRTALIERTSQEKWVNVGTGYIMVKQDGRLTYEHIVLAEKALGKPLPKGAIVHHMNQNRSDNYTPFNLVICPSQEYHLLLHRRMEEFGYGQNP